MNGMWRWLALVALVMMTPPAWAGELPRVVATIGPLHALAAGVMAGAGEPALLVPGGISPHTLVLRPSDARMLSRAELIFWIGPALESFMPRALASVASGAEAVAMLDGEGADAVGEDAHQHAADAHQHAADAHQHAADAHQHAAEAHQHAADAHQHAADAHQHAEEAYHHAHGHGGMDPHTWLDPRQAMGMVTRMAEALARHDPARAALYRENARRLREELEALDGELAQRLAPLAGVPLMVFHDAYGHLAARYGLALVGAVTLTPEQAPGARRVRELRQLLREKGVVCVFAEPQFRPAILTPLLEGSRVGVGTLDPLGVDLTPGAGAYFQLMRNLASGLLSCVEARQQGGKVSTDRW